MLPMGTEREGSNEALGPDPNNSHRSSQLGTAAPKRYFIQRKQSKSTMLGISTLCRDNQRVFQIV